MTLARGERQAPIALAATGPSLGQAQETQVATALTPDGVVAAWIGFRRVAGVGTLALRTAFLPAAGGPVEYSGVRRPGDRIRVTWTTDRASAGTSFVVAGAATRGGSALTLNAAVGTRHRRSFAVTLYHVRGVNFVSLTAYVPGRPRGRPLVIRVR